MNRGTSILIMGPWNVNRGPWNMFMEECNVFMAPWNVKWDLGM